MSTKIHNGYRLDLSGTGGGASDLFTFTHRLRAALNPVRDRIDATWLMNHAVHTIDVADRNGTPRPTMALMDAMFAFDEQQDAENAKGYRQASTSYAFDPHNFEVAFALDAPEATGFDTGTGMLLARVHTRNDDLLTAWEAMAEVEPFGFWDNADRPDDVDEAAWAERGDAFKRTAPHGAPTTTTSLTFKLRSSTADIGMLSMITKTRDADAEAARLQLLEDVAPTFESRVNARVRDLLFAEALRRHTGIDDRAEAVASLPTYEIFRLLRRYDQRITLRDLPEHDTLLSAAAATLDPHAVNAILHPTASDADQPSCFVDMSAAQAAADALLDAEQHTDRAAAGAATTL